MRKHLSFIRFKFLTSLQFRSEVFLWIILDFIPFFILFFLFITIYQNHTDIRGFTLQQTLEYYFLASMLQGLTSVHFESWRAEEIRLGKIDTFLLRPFTYFKEIVLSEIAGKLFYLTVFIPMNVLLFILVSKIFHVQLFTEINFFTIPLFLLLLLTTFCIQLMLGMIITLLTFWFEGADGLQHFKWIIVSVFSGIMIPLEFMPPWLQSIANTLPFKYLYAFPIRYFQSQQTIQFVDVVTIIFTLTGLLLCTKALLKFGLNKYSSSGG